MISRAHRLAIPSTLMLALLAGAAFAQQGPANPKNPQDWIGKQHNAGLDHAIRVRDSAGSRPAPVAAAVVAAAQDFACAANSECRANTGAVRLAARIAAFPAESEDEIAASLTEAQKGFYRQILDVVDANAERPDGLYAEMKRVEDQILRSGLSEKEMLPLLAGASVARFSTDYWHRQAADPSTPWGGGNGGPSILRLKDILKSDLKGAIGGAIGGVGGGLAGMGLGALLGGLGASAITAIDTYL